MRSMRQILPLFFLLLSFSVLAQDKIYLLDNSLIQGKIIEMDEKKVHIQISTTDKNDKVIQRKEIAVIIFENGQSLVIETKKKERTNLPEWSIGTNILQPLEGIAGLMIDKNISKRYSIRIGQTFEINGYNGLGATTSFLNNFYLGKGKVKWLNSFGLNLEYSENQYSIYEGPMLMVADLIWPYPQNGFNSRINLQFSFGTGIYVDLTKHLSFSTQFQLSHNLINPNYSFFDLDLNNTGFSFFYKF